MADYQVVIVGAGPAGLAAGVQAAKRGISHVVLERGRFAETVQQYQKRKLVMAEPELLPLQPELEEIFGFEEGTREDVLGRWLEGVREAGVELRFGADFEVKGIEGENGDFQVETSSGECFSAEKVVIAIGLRGNPRRFRLKKELVEGESLDHVKYGLEDPDDVKNERVVIVGAGDSGIENALALMEGNEVSLVNRAPAFGRPKPRNRSLIQKAIRERAIEYYSASVVEKFEPDSICLLTNDGRVDVEADRVIGQLGALPPREFLESIGVDLPSEHKEAIPKVDEKFQSSKPGIYLVGTVSGQSLIKECMNAGYEVIEHILGNSVAPAEDPLLARRFEAIPRKTVGVSADASETQFVSAIVAKIKDTVPLFGTLTPIQIREVLSDSKIHAKRALTPVYEKGLLAPTLFTILEGCVEILLPGFGNAKSTTVELQAGEFFGETGLLMGRPRSGKVTVARDALLIETGRSTIINLLRDNPEVEKIINEVSIDRMLTNLLPEIAPEERRQITAAAEFRRYQAGDMILEEGKKIIVEGDEPDGLHLIRRGSVAVLRGREDDAEGIVAIRGTGNHIGQIALLVGDRETHAMSVKALVFTETLLLPVPAAQYVMDRSPATRAHFARLSLTQWESYALPPIDLETEVLKESGIGEATDLLVIDEALCIRCDNCETACADTHDGVSRLDREHGTHIANIHIPHACLHCRNPACMTDCPPRCIHLDEETNLVYIETNDCISCGNCVTNCPYHAIQLEPLREDRRPNLLMRLLFGDPRGGRFEEGKGKDVALKCDMCRAVPLPPRSDLGKGVACAQACPTGAIVRVTPATVLERIISESE